MATGRNSSFTDESNRNSKVAVNTGQHLRLNNILHHRHTKEQNAFHDLKLDGVGPR